MPQVNESLRDSGLAVSPETARQSLQGGLAVSKERRLGRGLEALLGRAWDDSDSSTAAPAVAIAAGDVRMSRDEKAKSGRNANPTRRNPTHPPKTSEKRETPAPPDTSDTPASWGRQ